MTSSVNSKTCEIREPGASLLAFLRSDLGLTGSSRDAVRVFLAQKLPVLLTAGGSLWHWRRAGL